MLGLIDWVFAERKRLWALQAILAFVEVTALWLVGVSGEYLFSHIWPLLFFMLYVKPISAKWATETKGRQSVQALGLFLLLVIPIDFAVSKAGFMAAEIILTVIVGLLALVQIVVNGPSFFGAVKSMIYLYLGNRFSNRGSKD